MSNERRCRVCGCTESSACVTAAGPCHWVAEDLCSACDGSHPLALNPSDLSALLRVRFSEQFPGPHAFQILTALQLALRHPKFPPAARETVEAYARLFADEMGVTRNLVRLAQAGFHPEYDVAAVEQPRIILPGS